MFMICVLFCEDSLNLEMGGLSDLKKAGGILFVRYVAFALGFAHLLFCAYRREISRFSMNHLIDHVVINVILNFMSSESMKNIARVGEEINKIEAKKTPHEPLKCSKKHNAHCDRLWRYVGVKFFAQDQNLLV